VRQSTPRWRTVCRARIGSDIRGKAAAVLDSIMASADVNRVEPFDYVRDLLSQLSGCLPPAVAALLPDGWLAAYTEARRY
jgi:hypothetical protein